MENMAQPRRNVTSEDIVSAHESERESLLDGGDDDDFFLKGPAPNPIPLAGATKLSQVKLQVEEVTNVMRENVSKLFERGDRLEELQGTIPKNMHRLKAACECLGFHFDLSWMDEGGTSKRTESVILNEEEALQILKSFNFEEAILNEFMEDVSMKLHNTVIPKFWKLLELQEASEPFAVFCDAVHELSSSLRGVLARVPLMERLRPEKWTKCGQTTVLGLLKLHLKTELKSQRPLHYKNLLIQFYSRAFKIFHHRREIGVNQELKVLGLLECLVGDVLTSIVHETIQNHVQATCKGSFDVSHVDGLEKWLRKVVLDWFTIILGNPGDTFLETLEARLLQFLFETYTHTRMEQLFTIVIEFPESQPALEDLKECLEKTNLRTQLIQSLKAALQTRLLHPGVNTADILTAYISAIKALRVLDPSGVMLELACGPVREYLKTREDTVKRIVLCLTDEYYGDLTEELGKVDGSGGTRAAGGTQGNKGSHEPMEVRVGDWQHWMPDPWDAAPPSIQSLLPASENPSDVYKNRSADIVSMLIGIYETKDKFVTEYRTILANRILRLLSFESKKETRYLELLKLRFGESLLHNCEVMLKDVADSKRINAFIHGLKEYGMPEFPSYPVESMIVSDQFWPTIREEKLELPASVKEHLDIYTKAFEMLKGNRTLHWKTQLGIVHMDLELEGGRTINLMGKGLIREVNGDKFILVEDGYREEKPNLSLTTTSEDDDEANGYMASASDQHQEKLQVYWTYIMGMLTNIESLTLEKMHSMLRMFTLQGPQLEECTQAELREFLDQKVRNHELMFVNGSYRLVKKG
ncbi:unnamed protein product [Darwinula stevensoni]|uniref:Anaphase-promoting complex subunit 2 n=1 Tax=Darwinula stevensoni TaxID=69355 RepID=A0A7R8XKL6_9CRUS|nr:unnamed protein product [Darwinula stevensoni]CAG0895375.1 unnamed protein product [Darwinula stevensoni]